jgi:hypothetical protein
MEFTISLVPYGKNVFQTVVPLEKIKAYLHTYIVIYLLTDLLQIPIKNSKIIFFHLKVQHYMSPHLGLPTISFLCISKLESWSL